MIKFEPKVESNVIRSIEPVNDGLEKILCKNIAIKMNKKNIKLSCEDHPECECLVFITKRSIKELAKFEIGKVCCNDFREILMVFFQIDNQV